MVKFKTFLKEAAGKGLTMFDVDETMFITKVKLLKNWIINSLTRIGKKLEKNSTSANSKTPKYSIRHQHRLHE